MSKLSTHKFCTLYEMDSGISSKPEQAGHGAPFLSFSAVFNNYFLPENLADLMDTSEREQRKYSVLKGDIFLTRTSETIDELGMSSVALKDYPRATYSGFLKRLRPTQTDVTYYKFMAFYLRSAFFRKTMTNNAVLTLRASLNEDIFSYLDLILPDYEEQIKIGDLLYLLNQKIELNNSINAELEAMAKVLYDYCFVQFDFPDENGRPYKSSGGKMVFNERLKRYIPHGWKVQTFYKNDITEIIKPGINFFNGEKIYLPTAKVDNDRIADFSYKVTFETRESRANMQPIANSVWFAKMKNSVKHLYFGDYSEYGVSNIILSTGMLGLVCNPKAFEYIWKVVRSEYFEKLKDILSHGATQESINNDDLKHLPMLVPSEDALEYFSEKMRAVYIKKHNNEIENLRLAELRDWLLPMLMNGQVKVTKGGAADASTQTRKRA